MFKENPQARLVVVALVTAWSMESEARIYLP
jgi:hypothetical protein